MALEECWALPAYRWPLTQPVVICYCCLISDPPLHFLNKDDIVRITTQPISYTVWTILTVAFRDREWSEVIGPPRRHRGFSSLNANYWEFKRKCICKERKQMLGLKRTQNSSAPSSHRSLFSLDGAHCCLKMTGTRRSPGVQIPAHLAILQV